MIRPPSVVKSYDAWFSGDPAFVQLEDGASEDERAEHTRKWTVARETGAIGDLLVPGAFPTKFVMRPLSGSVFRKILDRRVGGKIGSAEQLALAFRCAVVSVENLGDVKVDRRGVEDYGEIATPAIVDALDAIDLSIVTELGSEAMRRAGEPSPLS